MPFDHPIAVDVAALAATYLVHSTILLGGAWLVVVLLRVRNAAVCERLWKTAPLGGLCTAALSFATGWTNPVVEWALPERPSNPVAAENAEVVQRSHIELDTARDTGKVLESELVDQKSVSGITRSTDPGEFIGHENSRRPTPSHNWTPHSIDVTAPLQTSRDKARHDGETLDATSDPVEISKEVPGLASTEHNRGRGSGVQNSVFSSKFSRSPESSRTKLNSGRPTPSPGSTSHTTAGAAPQQTTEEPPQVVHTPRTVVNCIGLAMYVILACGFLHLFVHAAMFRRWFDSLEPINDGPTHVIMRRLLKRVHAGRRVRLLHSETVVEPAAFGLFRWTIVLPTGIADRLPRKEFEALLAHELGHLVRGDAWWLWIGQALCCFLWWQPLNFLARRRWRAASEELADDWAVRSGVRPTTLARCLTRAAERRIDRSENALLLAVTGNRNRLSARVERLLNESVGDARPAKRRARLVLLTAILVSAGLGRWGPRATWSDSGTRELAQTDSSRRTTDVRVRRESATRSTQSRPTDEDVRRTGQSPLQTGDVNATSRSDAGIATTAMTQLLNDLKRLDGDLARVVALLDKRRNKPGLQTAAVLLKRRRAALRQRIDALVDSGESTVPVLNRESRE